MDQAHLMNYNRECTDSAKEMELIKSPDSDYKMETAEKDFTSWFKRSMEFLYYMDWDLYTYTLLRFELSKWYYMKEYQVERMLTYYI